MPMSERPTTGCVIDDLPDLKAKAEDVRSHLLSVKTFFDFGTAEDPTHERALFQLVFRVNCQNYYTMLSLLATNHVVLAGHCARALLEESIRWEWMTDQPEERFDALIGELLRNLRNIEDECTRMGADPEPFLNPSPFWDTDALRPFEPAKGFPNIEQMLSDIQQVGDAALADAGFALRFNIKGALYAQYRVLSQLTHTSVLGMMTSMQYEDGLVSVANRLPEALLALILQCSVASVVNVASYTVKFFVDEEQSEEALMAWMLRANGLASQMAELAGPRHGLTTFA
jgi:hypothetical protein